MTDWGVPDWRDESSYPDVSDWHLTRWIWEAVRRRADYRQESMGFLEKMKNGWEDNEQQVAFEAYWLKWGYSDKVLDPRISDYSQSELLRASHKGAGVSHFPGSSEHQVSIHVQLEANEIAVIFCLDKPFSQQLESAKQVFEQAQIKRHPKNKKRGPMPGANGVSETKKYTWLKFLRVLDADNLKVSPYEIAKQLDLVPKSHLGHDAHKMLTTAGKSIRLSALGWSGNITEISHPPPH